MSSDERQSTTVWYGTSKDPGVSFRTTRASFLKFPLPSLASA